jgi:osmotically-inducible protein OsmY
VKKVGGVRAVENQLQVVSIATATAVEASDDKLTTAIDKKLAASPELSDAKIGVEVSKGVARLTRSVESQSDRLLALTSSAPGVRSVIDALNVNAPAGAR